MEHAPGVPKRCYPAGKLHPASSPSTSSLRVDVTHGAGVSTPTHPPSLEVVSVRLSGHEFNFHNVRTETSDIDASVAHMQLSLTRFAVTDQTQSSKTHD